MPILNEEMTTPDLYKLDSKGVTRVWRAWSVLNDDGTATECNESGIHGGKLSGIPVTITSGKNIGKRNETTPLQQANKKIESKYTKKLREGYVTDINEFVQQGVMAAQTWSTSKHRMSQIALHQPKLDGIRLKARMNDDDDLKFISKSNKEHKEFLYELPWAKHLLLNMGSDTRTDGELYIHGLPLNDIASLVMSYKYNTSELLDLCEDTDEGLRINLKAKQILDQVYIGRFQPEADIVETVYEARIHPETGVEYIPDPTYKKADWLHPKHNAIEVGRNKGWIIPGLVKEDIEVYGSTDLEYWIFDVPDQESTAEQRNLNLDSTWNSQEDRDNQVYAVIAEEFNIGDIESASQVHLDNGFEGIMVRMPSGLYAFGSRSHVLLKHKPFKDAEWVITGYSLDREGNPNFKFTSDAGIEFECRPVGDRAWRAKLLSDMDLLIGLRATIRYQMLYPVTLCPQFGRVIAIRNYE